MHFEIGASHLQAENYPLALQNFLEAEKLSPADHRIQNALGLVYFHREKLELSEKHFKKALQIKPKDTETRNNLSQLFIAQKRFDEAEKELGISVADLTFAQPEKSYFLMGYSKFTRGDFAGSIPFFESALKYKKDDCQIHNFYGRAFFELKKNQEASAALDRAVGFCQNILYDEPHYYSALVYYRLGDVEKSRARFREVFQIYPEGKYRMKAKSMLDMMKKVQKQ